MEETKMSETRCSHRLVVVDIETPLAIGTEIKEVKTCLKCRILTWAEELNEI